MMVGICKIVKNMKFLVGRDIFLIRLNMVVRIKSEKSRKMRQTPHLMVSPLFLI
jgi:hypothetical protein